MKLLSVVPELGGNLQVAWAKPEGGEHRTLIPKGGDVAAHLKDVGSHMGFDPSEDLMVVQAFAEKAWGKDGNT